MKNQKISVPAFLDDGPSVDLPVFISTTNARELYGLREGEIVSDAMARHKQECAERASQGKK